MRAPTAGMSVEWVSRAAARGKSAVKCWAAAVAPSALRPHDRRDSTHLVSYCHIYDAPCVPPRACHFVLGGEVRTPHSALMASDDCMLRLG